MKALTRAQLDATRTRTMRVAALVVIAAMIGCERTRAPVITHSPDSLPFREPTPISAPGLHNAFRVSERVYSGSSPDGDEGFAELERLGIKTVISVDGSRPDVEAARRHGMTYVHLPFGYDGIPRRRLLDLARAANTVEGPIYVHCHHGQHRGPAAVAAIEMCTDAKWDADRAAAWLKRAGTDPRYTGLWGLPRSLIPPSPTEIERVPAQFPSVAPIGNLTQLMVHIDATWDRLKLIKAAGWAAPPGHPDVEPAHEALMLLEHFREAGRLDDVKERGSEFQNKVHETGAAASELEAALREKKPERAVRVFERIDSNCTACHRRFRDPPH